jgi:hypothetical protein
MLWGRLRSARSRRHLAKLRDWAVRFHLNQVAQLHADEVRRPDSGGARGALRIHGFDGMIWAGYDSNLAARLALYRGRVDT